MEKSLENINCFKIRVNCKIPVATPSILNSSVQFSSVAQSYLTLCDPMDCSTPGLPVHHQLPEFSQTHVHRVSELNGDENTVTGITRIQGRM